MSRRFWTPLVRELHPYVPGEQPRHRDLLKLNTNESPYPPSPRVIEAVRTTDGAQLLRYPDPSCTQLRAAVARRHGVQAEQIFVGNGSDEVLAHCFAALIGRERKLLIPDISYSFYPVWCQHYRVDYERVPLRPDFSIDVTDYDRGASRVILPNPNAPTGCLLPLSAIRQLLRAGDRLVVIDEAYIDFGGESAVSLIDEFDNLLVIQTLSKSRALAGLRIGLAFGQAPLIEALERVKDSFNSYPVDCVAQSAALASYGDEGYFQQCCRQVMEQRERLSDGLREHAFEVLPSAANFVFARHARVPGAQIFSALRERGIILRRWDKPRIADFLRISVGTVEQVTRLLREIDDVLSPGGEERREAVV